MKPPRVYVETTIPSFYHGDRSAPAIAARQRWTRVWWTVAEERFQLLTGAPVIEELRDGPRERAEAWLSLIAPLPVLEMTPDVDLVVDHYLGHKLMPRGDALHLAVSSVNGCEYIATWNCRHLANPNKTAHIRQINERLGFGTPEILTPLEMLEKLL
jgi:predicted nucleic acid-binding protein